MRRRSKRNAAMILTPLVLTLVGILIAAIMGGTSSDEWTRGYLPCATEDSVGPCYWDAESRGNGQGRSFVVVDDVVTYVNR